MRQQHPLGAATLAAVGLTWLVVSGWRRSLTWGATSAEVASTLLRRRHQVDVTQAVSPDAVPA